VRRQNIAYTCIRGGTRTATDFPYHSAHSAATHDPPTPRHLLRRCSHPPEPRTSSALPPSPPILLGTTMERLTRSSPRQPFRLSSPSPSASPSPLPPPPRPRVPCPFPHRRMRERASLPFLHHALSSLFSAYIYHFGGRSVSHPWQCIPHLLPFPSATASPVPPPPPRWPRPPPLAPLCPLSLLSLPRSTEVPRTSSMVHGR